MVWHLNFGEAKAKLSVFKLKLILTIIGSNFLSLGDGHKKESLPSFIWNLKVDSDLKGRFLSFKFTSSNDRVLSVYAPSGYSTRKQLDRERFFKGLQIYVGNKYKGNENKAIFEDFDCTMDKIDRDDESKIQKLYWCCSSYVLSLWVMGLRIYEEGRN